MADRWKDPTAPQPTRAERRDSGGRDPEVERAGGGRTKRESPSGSRVPAAEGEVPPEDPLLLGRPPGAHEADRPAIGQSASQAWPGAFGEHANPEAPGEAPKGAVVLGPGEVLVPRRKAEMSPTGAAEGRHPPAPPYGGAERRVAQHDWDRWRAEDRRKVPFAYPEWRT